MPFTNPARKDGAVFHHWRRVADEGKDYPFAKFNKVGVNLKIVICIFKEFHWVSSYGIVCRTSEFNRELDNWNLVLPSFMRQWVIFLR